MHKVGQQNKKTITGDYYEIHKNGIYRRHTDVSVHCHHSDIINQKTNHEGMCQNNPEMQEHRKKIESMILKSRFAQNCKQILEKEQVNSIHEQDPNCPSQQVKLKSNNHYVERRQKNMNMRRSTQNQASPKKGILKRSLIDKKQEQIIDNQDRKAYKMDNKSAIANNELYTKNQMSPALAENDFQIAGQQVNKSSLSWGKEENLYQNTNNQHMALTERVGDNMQRSNKDKIKRQNTEGKQTVAILPAKNQLREQQADGATLDMYSNCAFEQAVYQQLQFLKQRLSHLQKQLVDSQQRMKKYDLERELSKSKAQIQKLKKQNQMLKSIKSKQQKQKSSSNGNLSGVQQIIKQVTKNSTFLISFILALLVCLTLGKSTTTCSK